jgi:hypothetical protein
MFAVAICGVLGAWLGVEYSRSVKSLLMGCLQLDACAAARKTFEKRMNSVRWLTDMGAESSLVLASAQDATSAYPPRRN